MVNYQRPLVTNSDKKSETETSYNYEQNDSHTHYDLLCINLS